MESKKAHEKRENVFRKSGLDGLVHAFAFTNLFSGEKSLGNKIMNYTMYKSGVVDYPMRFAAGFFTEIALEAAVVTYSIMEIYHNNSAYMLANMSLKILPRVIDSLGTIDRKA